METSSCCLGGTHVNSITLLFMWSCGLWGRLRSYSIWWFCWKYGGLFCVYFWLFAPYPSLPDQVRKAFYFICLSNWFAEERKYKSSRQPLNQSTNVCWCYCGLKFPICQSKYDLNPNFCAKASIEFQRSVCECPSRCGFSGGPGLPPGMGHPVLDQLHHIHDQQTHSGPKQSGRLCKGGRGHALRGWPPTHGGPGWVSEVSRSFNSIKFYVGFKIWFRGLKPAFKSLYRLTELRSTLLTLWANSCCYFSCFSRKNDAAVLFRPLSL